MKNDDYPIYFSGYEMYGRCPLSYLYKYSHPEVDAGWGVGQKVPWDLRAKDSKHHAVFGIAMALAVENFYNNQYWKNPRTARDRVREDALGEIRRGLSDPNNYIDWYPNWTPKSEYNWRLCPPLEEVERNITVACDNFIDIVKANSILSPDAQAEMELKWDTGLGFWVGSKPDIVYTRKDGTVEIVDGKNSRTIGRYNDVDQLLWYCLVHWKVTGVMPQHASFLYFQHPPGTRKRKDGTLWTGIVPVEVNEESLTGVWNRILQFKRDIDDKKFDPVVAFHCSMCQFNTVCPAYREKREADNTPLLTKKAGKFVEIV